MVLDQFSEQRIEQVCRGRPFAKAANVRTIIRQVLRKFPTGDEAVTVDGVEHSNVSYGRMLGRCHSEQTEQAVWDFLVGN